MGRGRMTKCIDCGIPLKALKKELRPLCRKCKKRHHPFKKTKAIRKLYERKKRR